MPSRNRLKNFIPETYYHVYNRGVNKRDIFKDDEDYRVFLNLLKRYLSAEPEKDLKGRKYANYYDEIELLAYCLMPNHFHLCFYQLSDDAITKIMHGLMTSYSAYFNKKYRRVGPLFQDRFKASAIYTDAYVIHISRYIHLNPRQYKKWPYSSLPYYLGLQNASWVRPDRLLQMFDSVKQYKEFLADYEDYKKHLDDIKHSLANY